MSEYTTNFHMGHSITGPLRNWSKSDWKRGTKYITKDGGGQFTPDELKDEFLKMLSEGKEVFPMGGPCDKWDWKTGCKGHSIPKEAGK